MVLYSRLFKSFPQFLMIHTVKGFGIVNETEVDVFLEFPSFLYDPAKLGLMLPISLLVFLNPVCIHAKSLQSCPTLCDPMDCSLPGSSVHGILQSRILEWVDMPISRGSSQPRNWTHVSLLHWQGTMEGASRGKHSLGAQCKETVIY